IKSHNTEITEAVSTVTWTANPGVRIGPGEFEEFEVSAGPLPETDKLIIPATQTYDSGKVVEWKDQPAAAGQPEPEHPAPALAVQAKNGKSDDHGATAQTSTSDSHEHADASAQDDTARWLGGGGLAG